MFIRMWKRFLKKSVIRKRKALYGSVRAVLMGEELIDSPFGVINAVNFTKEKVLNCYIIIW